MSICYSLLTSGAAISDRNLGVTEVPQSFLAQFPSSEASSDNTADWKLGKSDFWVPSEPPFFIYSLFYCSFIFIIPLESLCKHCSLLTRYLPRLKDYIWKEQTQTIPTCVFHRAECSAAFKKKKKKVLKAAFLSCQREKCWNADVIKEQGFFGERFQACALHLGLRSSFCRECDSEGRETAAAAAVARL